MKKISLLTVMLFALVLSATTIGRITDITNGRKVLGFNDYTGGIHQIGNRLIVQGAFKTEEFEILPDGELHLISYQETKFKHNSYKNEDRLYVFGGKDSLNGTYNFTVFDISVSPITLIAKINTNLNSNEPKAVLFTEDHILLTDNVRRRTVKINKNTFEIDGHIVGLFSNQLVKSDTTLFWVQRVIIEGNITDVIKIYRINDLDTLDLTELSTINSPLDGVVGIDFTNDKLIVFGYGGTLIIDVDDLYNPFIYTFIPISNTNYIVNAHYTGEFLLTQSILGELRFYKLADSSFTRVYEEHVIVPFARANVFHCIEPFIFFNSRESLVVYDTSKNFSVVQRYGIFFYDIFHVSNKYDLFVLERNIYNNSCAIHSSVNQSVLGTLSYPSRADFFNFSFLDDKLYVSYRLNNILHFEVYLINEQIERISSQQLGNNDCWGFIVSDNRVFFRFASPDRVVIYDIDTDKLKYIGTINGRLQSTLQNFANDYIIISHNNRLMFVCKYDIHSVLFETQLHLPFNAEFHYITDGFIAVTYDWHSGIPMRVFEYCLAEQFLRQFHNFNTRGISEHGTIFTNPAWQSNTSEFFSIFDGRVNKVGEKYDTRRVGRTFFFPEINKIVQMSGSSVWVYDFEFEEHVSEYDETVPIARTGLLGNHPNPFNPYTTINFVVARHALPVQIDIYNIRGQRVRTLLDGSREFGSGEHSVVWDGRDDNGREVGSGMYLYRMRAGEDVSVRRMVLMK